MIAIDEPALGMTVGINTSPLAGQSGTRLTARMVAIGSSRSWSATWRSACSRPSGPTPGRCRAAASSSWPVLVETMRREGFELTVGKPQVVTREVDGAVHEPIERLAIDVPEDFLGVVTQMLALRKGRLENMVNHGTGGSASTSSSPRAA